MVAYFNMCVYSKLSKYLEREWTHFTDSFNLQWLWFLHYRFLISADSRFFQVLASSKSKSSSFGRCNILSESILLLFFLYCMSSIVQTYWQVLIVCHSVQKCIFILGFASCVVLDGWVLKQFGYYRKHFNSLELNFDKHAYMCSVFLDYVMAFYDSV